VAQRDNDLSLANARYSQKIAEATKEDSAVMKQLAKDSKELAKRTYLDSVSMRLMAVVNLCTMPGTFTAVSLTFSPFPTATLDPSKVDVVSDHEIAADDESLLPPRPYSAQASSISNLAPTTVLYRPGCGFTGPSPFP
jgi:hypothetical protein